MSPGVWWRVVGGALLLTTAGIHLDLYLTGYRHIPTIGTLFLLQVAGAAVLGVAVIAGARVAALAGAGFALSTLGGYILSLWVGLFGFHEVRTTAGVVAGAVELAAFLALGAYAARAMRGPNARAQVPARAARRAVGPIGALGTLAFVLAVANSPGAASKSTRAGRADGGVVVDVAIKNFAFFPATLAASPGERIAVTNHDSVAHTFTAVPGAAAGGHFTSGDIAPGATVVVRAPSAKGTYPFSCAIHPFMTGTLAVS